MNDKRSASTSFREVQTGSQRWWTQNPMAYDWRNEIKPAPGTLEWFDAIDARFIYGARLFAHDKAPFDQVIPFDRLAGRRVLEIGCGMGLHTELLTRAGAEVNAVDLSDTSIDFTRKRLELKRLKADVQRSDGERLDFRNDEFDFVWSWGVIHHSSRTGRIVREIARVLKPGGEARVMVYNRDGAGAWITFWLQYILRLGIFERSFDEQLFRATDGFMARYYTCDQFEDLFRTFFDDVKSQIFGQDVDAVPLPRLIRKYALSLFSENRLKKMQTSRGGFIFLTAQSKV